jgi:hypothetical protein
MTTTSPHRLAAARVPPTAARTHTTAVPTEPRDRFALLSRCIGIDPHAFATEFWGRRPLLSPSQVLPRDFSDLLLPDTVDELIADKVMTFPMSCADAVAALHRGLAADATALPGLDHADAAVLIRRLLREAVVVPVDG